jgi:hypothetical protein
VLAHIISFVGPLADNHFGHSLIHVVERSQDAEKIEGAITQRTEDPNILASPSLVGGFPNVRHNVVCFGIQDQETGFIAWTRAVVRYDLPDGGSQQRRFAAASGTNNHDVLEQISLAEINLAASRFVARPRNDGICGFV